MSDLNEAGFAYDFLNLAKRRFSVRKYRKQAVGQEHIDAILEAGRVAPTAANYQPQKIIIIKSDDGFGRLAKGANTFDAPLAFIICADKTQAWVRPFDKKSMVDIDASIVTDHMMLAATDLGLGSLWMTYFDPSIIRREFNIPENFEIVNILLVGHSAQSGSPERHVTERKKIGEIIQTETF